MQSSVVLRWAVHPPMNEALLVASAIVDLGLVLLAFSRKNAWVYATIVVNLLLISVFGQKLIEVWGFVTNVGTVYYASVFFAIYLLLENGTRAHVIRALSIGALSVAAFTVLLVLVVAMQSHPETATLDAMMRGVFGNAPRFALASLAGFVLAQVINTTLYLTSREEPAQIHWWLRSLVIMLIAQLVDSIVFFTIAFWGVVATPLVAESMAVGYVVKVLIGALSLPLIYMSGRLKRGSTHE